MNLTEFANDHLGEPLDGHPFETVAPDAAHNLHDVLGPKAPVEPLLATFFWQIAQTAPGFDQVLHQLGVSGVPIAPPEVIIVPRGPANQTRYDLLILGQNIASPPKEQVLKLSASSLRQGYQAWERRRLFELERADTRDLSVQQLFHRLIRAVPADFAIRAAKQFSFSLLAAELPPVEYTSVPPRVWGVADSPGAKATSSAGAVVRDAKGHPGVTAALHAINGKTTALCIGNAVEVDGRAGIVGSADLVSDSCFIELDPLPGKPKTTAGPLIGFSPHQYETASFDGLKSGSTKAIVQGWSSDIPLVMSNNQLKVFTDNVTNPGDSGAALLDKVGNILGFCFYRSNTASPYYSAWIWAHSVFTALKLTAF
jgi:hypothetical protein